MKFLKYLSIAPMVAPLPLFTVSCGKKEDKIVNSADLYAENNQEETKIGLVAVNKTGLLPKTIQQMLNMTAQNVKLSKIDVENFKNVFIERIKWENNEDDITANERAFIDEVVRNLTGKWMLSYSKESTLAPSPQINQIDGRLTLRPSQLLKFLDMKVDDKDPDTCKLIEIMQGDVVRQVEIDISSNFADNSAIIITGAESFRQSFTDLVKEDLKAFTNITTKSDITRYQINVIIPNENKNNYKWDELKTAVDGSIKITEKA